MRGKTSKIILKAERKSICTILRRENPNYRCWMQFDEFINIDFLCDNFNDLFHVNRFPAVLVTIPEKAQDLDILLNWGYVKKSIN